MNGYMRDLWIAALRSGEYAQSNRNEPVSRTSEGKEALCAMMVLIDLSVPHWREIGEIAAVPIMVERIGLKGRHRETTGPVCALFRKGKSFETIANWIEANI